MSAFSKKSVSVGPGQSAVTVKYREIDSRSTRTLQWIDEGYDHDVVRTVDRLGCCYRELNLLPDYIELFTSFLQRFPSEGWAVANLGSALLHAKEYKRAAICLKRAKKLGVKGVQKQLDIALSAACT